VIDIQPGVSVLSVLRNLNYEPWYALAEFVDNSVQSALTRHRDLVKVDGSDYQLRVEIEYDPSAVGRLVVRDNAAGILDRDYDRAFKTAARPPDVGNLAEFGMGMKSAGCWFANYWSVRSKGLGEPVERTVEFDVEKIVNGNVAVLPVKVVPADPTSHYTEVTLLDMHRQLNTRTVKKIKDHLAGIYRNFTKEGFLLLSYNNEELAYEEPRILKAPFYKEPDGKKRLWRKEIAIDLGGKKRVTGYAALREVASTSQAGFAVFRRKRLIQGSADNGYRPEQVFKKPNSYTYQRLFGELHVEGFGVTHTKDAIQWAGLEDHFLERLEIELNKGPIRLMDQAEGYRAKPKSIDLKKTAEGALESVSAVSSAIKRDLEQMSQPQIDALPPTRLPPAKDPFTREMEIDFSGNSWLVVVEATADPAVGDWLTVSDSPARLKDRRRVTIRVALGHPFMVRFAGTTNYEMEPIMRLAVGIGLAELVSRDGGVKMAGAIRRNLNQLLRNSLSRSQ
jgi:hypothetical protein